MPCACFADWNTEIEAISCPWSDRQQSGTKLQAPGSHHAPPLPASVFIIWVPSSPHWSSSGMTRRQSIPVTYL